MMFDPDNKVIQLCAQGMNLEGEGKSQEAHRLFQQAWNESTSAFERFTSAHYVARHQQTVVEKLKWDKTALEQALTIKDERVKGTLPSLYLNIGKCYEDLKDFDKAKENYQSALSLAESLSANGYGKMIKSGIVSGLERVTQLI